MFDTLLPDSLRFQVDQPESLAERVSGYETGGAGPELRAAVEAEHSVEHWAECVLEEAGA